ncbi:MAG: hypothetical protein JWR37_3336, partial [Mycobacterium sp.]|nr:hypothetical protein [Mycobacterium sp.]
IQKRRRRTSGHCLGLRLPLREVAPIAGMVAFYNEKLDIFVDGALLSRPKTIFT